jgi:hypothetical protein
MSKKAEDVIEEIFEAAGADGDARALKAPLRPLWKEDCWTAQQIAEAAGEAHERR